MTREIEGSRERCSVDGCSRLHYAKTVCRAHYAQVKKYGKITHKVIRQRVPAPEYGICEIPGCMEDFYAKGKCKRHYYRDKNGSTRLNNRYRYNDDGHRWCNHHQSFHPKESFGHSSEMADGLNGDCKSAKTEQGREWRYGITGEDFKEMLSLQNGLCALCGENEATQVDHNHRCCPTTGSNRKTCGKCTRELLCRQCNTKLGHLEKEGWLEMAMKYIERHGRKTNPAWGKGVLT